MAIKRVRQNLVYGITDDILAMPPYPVVSQRAPTTSDYAEVGTVWIDQPNDDAYVLTRVASKSATWINTGGGSGTFTSVTTTAGITCGTALSTGTTIFAGSSIESTTTVTVGTNLTVSGLGRGVVQSSAAGLFSSSEGTNGQLLISSSAGAPAWATITAGAGILVTNGANSITIDATGATASTFPTDVAGPVSPLAGATTLAGGTNITTDGSVANTVTFNLDDNVTLAGSLTAGVDLTMSTGTCTISADDDIAQSIYLHANGGTNETIEIYADQGTSTASIYIHSDDGGIDITSGLSTVDAINITCSHAAGGIDIDAGTGGIAVDTTDAISLDAAAASNFTVTGAFDLDLRSTAGSINVIAGEAAANAIVIDAANAAGGIDMDCGTGGFNLLATNGTVTIESGTAAINVGTGATAKDITIGSVTGAASLTLQSGTGDWIATSTDDMTLDAAGVVEINSSADVVSICNDAVNQALNIATGGDRTVTLGNTAGATQVDILSGTGAINVGTDATVKDVTVGSVTGAASLTLQSGTGDWIATSTDAMTLDAAGVLEINSSGDVVSICNDAVNQNLNIATGGNRTVTLGNTAGATQVDILSGTGAINVGTDATVKDVTVGSVTGASTTTIQSGTSGTIITSTGAITADAAGNVEINSSAGTIEIGNDAVAQNINIGTGAAQRDITIGNGTGTTSVTVDCGTGGASFGTTATAHATTIGSTDTTSSTTIQSGTGGISLSAAGNIDPNPATNSVAGVALTLDAKFGVAIFTGQSTASGAQETFTITNAEVSATSAIFVTVNNIGANDARMSLEQVKPAAGSFEVMTQNNGGAALNGNVIISFWVLN